MAKVAYRSAVRISEPNKVKKGYSCRWDFDVRYANCDGYVTHGRRVVAKGTGEDAKYKALNDAYDYLEALNRLTNDNSYRLR